MAVLPPTISTAVAKRQNLQQQKLVQLGKDANANVEELVNLATSVKLNYQSQPEAQRAPVSSLLGLLDQTEQQALRLAQASDKAGATQGLAAKTQLKFAKLRQFTAGPGTVKGAENAGTQLAQISGLEQGGIPPERAQTAVLGQPTTAGTPVSNQLKMAINKQDPTQRRQVFFNPREAKNYFMDTGEQVSEDWIVVTPQAQSLEATSLGLGPNQRQQTAQEARQAAAATSRIGQLLQRLKVLGNRTSGIRGTLAANVGGVLGQFNANAERAFNQFIGAASPQEVASFRAEARAVVASLVPETTGEGSARISDTERQIAQETLRLLDLEASAPQMQAALASMLKLKVLSVESMKFNIMGESAFRNDLETKDGRIAQAKELAALGMNEAQIISTILDMRAQRRQLVREFPGGG